MIKIGHRGAMGYAPENTIKSFEIALEMGVPMIELDVALCGSGEIVVIHDDRVDRTTNGTGYVSEMNITTLKNLDAGENEQIPTLYETMIYLAGKCQLNIELKNSAVVEPVVQLLQKMINESKWKINDIIISSFDHQALMKFQLLMPNVKIGVLVGIIPLNYAGIVGEIDAYSINPCLDFISEEFVLDARKRRLKVFVWTVNHLEDIEKMRKLEVDGVFTNYPDRL